MSHCSFESLLTLDGYQLLVPKINEGQEGKRTIMNGCPFAIKSSANWCEATSSSTEQAHEQLAKDLVCYYNDEPIILN